MVELLASWCNLGNLKIARRVSDEPCLSQGCQIYVRRRNEIVDGLSLLCVTNRMEVKYAAPEVPGLSQLGSGGKFDTRKQIGSGVNLGSHHGWSSKDIGTDSDGFNGHFNTDIIINSSNMDDILLSVHVMGRLSC